MRPEAGRPWFGPRAFGWGLSPIRWQGWASVGLFALALFGARRILGGPAGSGRFLAVAAILAAALFGLAWLKRDRTRDIRWRWGGD